MSKNGSGFYVTFSDFEYKDHKDKYFEFEIPFDIFIEGVRKYFDNQLVTLDGTDNAIYNCLVSFEGLFDTIVEEMEPYFLKECKEMAFEEYKEFVEEFYEDDVLY